jgi:hypothetical protein
MSTFLYSPIYHRITKKKSNFPLLFLLPVTVEKSLGGGGNSNSSDSSDDTLSITKIRKQAHTFHATYTRAITCRKENLIRFFYH